MKNSISLEEFKLLPAGSYQLIDIRGEEEIAHGAIPGAAAIPQDALLENEQLDRTKKQVICCSRGKFSVEAAEELAEAGYDAVSLEGGYIAWLLDTVKQQEAEDYCKEVEKSIRKKFRKTIWCRFVKAVKDYELVKPGDRIAVCISGGKDSMLMAKLFQEIKRHNKFDFELVFLVMDPGYSEVNRLVIEKNARMLGVPITIFETQIFDAVYDVKQSPCYLCARMRRGYLYSKAKELGCNKIALGHHYDDVIETTLMSMLYGAQARTMLPVIKSDNIEDMKLIRPMYLIREDDINLWKNRNNLNFVKCACRLNTKDGGEDTIRLRIKKLIRDLTNENPAVPANIFGSMSGIDLEHVLSYKIDGVTHSILDDM